MHRILIIFSSWGEAVGIKEQSQKQTFPPAQGSCLITGWKLNLEQNIWKTKLKLDFCSDMQWTDKRQIAAQK